VLIIFIFLRFFAYHFFGSQDVVVVLGEAVCFIPDVLQELAGGGVCGQFQWFPATL
jgi:hypothetical protein